MGDLSEDELETWLRPNEALSRLPEGWDDRTKRRAILGRISIGHIHCGAKTCVVQSSRRSNIDRRATCRVGDHLWLDPWSCHAEDLWTIGDLRFDNSPPLELVYLFVDGVPQPNDPEIITVSYTGVRLDPVSYRRAFDLPSLAGPEPEAKAPPNDQSADTKKPLPTAEAERFAKAVIAGWPQATQDWAHRKAALFFPDQTIGREQFRHIFRAIQGPKTRGKPPKNSN